MIIGSLKIEAMDGDHWRVLAPGFEVNLDPEFSTPLADEFVILIPEGFITDFASIPAPLRGSPLGHRKDTEQAAVVHDYTRRHGYLPLKNGKNVTVSEKLSDQIFKEMLKESGVGWWRRNAMYLAVRIGSAFN